jgi:hypothetical protein
VDGARLPDAQHHWLAGQFLQLGAEPVGFRTAMAGYHARPGSLDFNPDLVRSACGEMPRNRRRGGCRQFLQAIRTPTAQEFRAHRRFRRDEN